MVFGDGNIILWAVLIAPGFIAVMTAVRLSGLEDEIPAFVLLVWSLILSLFIAAVILGVYQRMFGGINSFAEMEAVLFEPHFRFDFVLYLFTFSFVVGVLVAGGIIVGFPGRARRLLQSKSRVKYSPGQPWANFLNETASLRIKASDENFFVGDVKEWSRAGRSKEVRIKNPHWWNPETGTYEKVGKTGNEEMLFLEKDINRLMLRTHDLTPTFLELIKAFVLRRELNPWEELEDYEEQDGDDLDDEMKAKNPVEHVEAADSGSDPRPEEE